MIKSLRAKRHGRNEREYTEAELSEYSQRALALRLSLSFDELKLRSIEFTPKGDCVADFRTTTTNERYRVTSTIVDGIATITRLQHEVKRRA